MDQEQAQEVLEKLPAPETVDPEAPPHAVFTGPVDVRSVALGVLAALAILAVLKWASALFIPLMVGFVFYYALVPVVDAMARVRIPRVLGAGVLILAVLGGIGGTLYTLSDGASKLIGSLPLAAQKLGDTMRRSANAPATPIATVQKAATELEQAAEAGDAKAVPRGVQRVVVERPSFNIRDYFWTSTLGLINLVGQITLVTFLTYFLLLSGDTFRRKLVKIAGPTLSQKKITVQALDEINAQVQHYLLVQLVASVGVGVLTGVVFAWLGMDQPAVWGVIAAVLNLIPYIGSFVVTAAAAGVAFLQFGTANMAAAVGSASLLIHLLEGNLLVPWLTSRAGRMNPVAVFVGVLVWGWLWGVWGLLLGVPIMMVIKAICDRVEDLKPVGELLGS